MKPGLVGGARRPDQPGRTQVRADGPGAVVDARADDALPGTDLLRSEAACSMGWRGNGFDAIHLFVDPSLRDRADELCAAIDGWSGVHRDLDDLSDEILRYADREGLSVGVYPRPRDDVSGGRLVSAGFVAITITAG